MGRWLGAGALVAVAIVVIVAVAAVPLVLVYQSNCPDGPSRATEYSFVLPWNDPPAECRDHRRGFEVVTDEIGL